MWKYGTLALAALLCAAPLSAQVVRLEITSREPMSTGQPAGAAGPFELIRGRIHGEVDPKDPHNAIIQDLDLAPRNAGGKVEYVATFALAKPVDLAKASHVLLYQVVNRGNGQATANAEGDITLVSGWQGDVIPTAANQSLVVPVARNKDGSPVTGRVIARLFDLPDGAHSAPIRLASLGTAQPYLPADLAQPDATLTWHSSENYAGQQDARHTVPRAAWAFANCENSPWPGTPDPSRICVKDAFRADRLYELVYTAKDPLVLGVGLAATRDIVSFFRHAAADALRHAESGGRRRRAHDQHRRLAVRQFHPDLHPPGLQPGHAEPHRLGRRVSANRGASDADQPALRAAGRRRRHVRAGQRRRRLVDAITPTRRVD